MTNSNAGTETERALADARARKLLAHVQAGQVPNMTLQEMAEKLRQRRQSIAFIEAMAIETGLYAKPDNYDREAAAREAGLTLLELEAEVATAREMQLEDDIAEALDEREEHNSPLH